MADWYNPFSWLSGPDYDNPADAAKPYLDKIPGAVQPYYQPYMDAGNRALPTLEQQYNMLINDPAGVMNNIGSGYTASPGYDYEVSEATNASNNAAAAGGYLGSPAQQKSLAGDISGIASQDYYKYLNDALSQYHSGLQGLSGINDMGYKANMGYSNVLSDTYNTEANLAYTGQSNENNNKNAWLNNLLKLGATGAGYAAGGPMGGYAMGKGWGG